MSIRGVLFDFYGTLAAAGPGPPMTEVLDRWGVRLTDAARRLWGSDALDGHEHAEASVSRDAYVAWEAERRRQLLFECGVGSDDVDQVLVDLQEWRTTFTMQAYPEVPAVLDELRRRNVLIAICSNWDWDLDAAVAQAGLTRLVDAQVTSAQAGCRKPHPRIYTTALEVIGTIGSETLFVGDSVHADVQGPLAAGLPVAHVWRHETEPPPLPDGATRISDLTGVLELLGG